MNGGRNNHEWGFGATDRVAGVGAQQQRPLSIPTFDLAAFLDGVAARRLPRLASGSRPPRVIVKMDVEGLDSTVEVPPWQCPSSASAPPQGAPGGSGQLALPGRGRPTGRPATASGARASRLQSPPISPLVTMQARVQPAAGAAAAGHAVRRRGQFYQRRAAPAARARAAPPRRRAAHFEQGRRPDHLQVPAGSGGGRRGLC